MKRTNSHRCVCSYVWNQVHLCWVAVWVVCSAAAALEILISRASRTQRMKILYTQTGKQLCMSALILHGIEDEEWMQDCCSKLTRTIWNTEKKKWSSAANTVFHLSAKHPKKAHSFPVHFFSFFVTGMGFQSCCMEQLITIHGESMKTKNKVQVRINHETVNMLL